MGGRPFAMSRNAHKTQQTQKPSPDIRSSKKLRESLEMDRSHTFTNTHGSKDGEVSGNQDRENRGPASNDRMKFERRTFFETKAKREGTSTSSAHKSNKEKAKLNLRENADRLCRSVNKAEQESIELTRSVVTSNLATQLAAQKLRLVNRNFLRSSTMPVEATPELAAGGRTPPDSEKSRMHIPSLKAQETGDTARSALYSRSTSMPTHPRRLSVQELVEILKDKIPMMAPGNRYAKVKQERSEHTHSINESMSMQLQKQRHRLTKPKIARSLSLPISPQARLSVKELAALLEGKLSFLPHRGNYPEEAQGCSNHSSENSLADQIQKQRRQINQKQYFRSKSTPTVESRKTNIDEGIAVHGGTAEVLEVKARYQPAGAENRVESLASTTDVDEGAVVQSGDEALEVRMKFEQALVGDRSTPNNSMPLYTDNEVPETRNVQGQASPLEARNRIQDHIAGPTTTAGDGDQQSTFPCEDETEPPSLAKHKLVPNGLHHQHNVPEPSTAKGKLHIPTTLAVSPMSAEETISVEDLPFDEIRSLPADNIHANIHATLPLEARTSTERAHHQTAILDVNSRLKSTSIPSEIGAEATNEQNQSITPCISNINVSCRGKSNTIGHKERDYRGHSVSDSLNQNVNSIIKDSANTREDRHSVGSKACVNAPMLNTRDRPNCLFLNYNPPEYKPKLCKFLRYNPPTNRIQLDPTPFQRHSQSNRNRTNPGNVEKDSSSLSKRVDRLAKVVDRLNSNKSPPRLLPISSVFDPLEMAISKVLLESPLKIARVTPRDTIQRKNLVQHCPSSEKRSRKPPMVSLFRPTVASSQAERPIY